MATKEKKGQPLLVKSLIINAQCNFYLLVALELKLMEESGLAACFAKAVAVLCMNLAKLGVYPLLGSVGVVGSFFSKGPGAGGSGSCNR